MLAPETDLDDYDQAILHWIKMNLEAETHLSCVNASAAATRLSRSRTI